MEQPKFKLPWKSSSLVVICLVSYALFSPGRVQSLLGIERGPLILLELSLAAYGVFNFLVMFNQEVVSEATFREYYGWVMYLVHWLAIIGVTLLVMGIITREYSFRNLFL